MYRFSRIVVGSAVVGCLVASSVKGAKPPSKPAPDAAAVAHVLRSELTGAVDRRNELREILQSSGDMAASRWQAGFVREGKAWRSFDAASHDEARVRKLAEYAQKRASAPATAEGQLTLAKWCRQHNLPDEEQAHLNAALAADPEGRHPDVVERLGFRRVKGVWLSPEQLTEWREQNLATRSSLKRWETRLGRLAGQLTGSERQQKTARDALQKLIEPGMIPALELLLSGRSEQAGLAVVDALSRVKGFEASLALAKQGVFSQWGPVREAAAQALKQRPLEEFVPQLIGLLEAPFTTNVEFVQMRYDPRRRHVLNGALLYSFVMSRETPDQFQVASFNTFNAMVDDYVGAYVSLGAQQGGIDEGLRMSIARGKNEADQAMREEVARRQGQVDRLNESINQLNERVGAVLAVVSGQSATSTPQEWWSWWDAANETTSTGPKQVVRVDEFSIQGNTVPSTPNAVPFTQMPTASTSAECLAAGTTIWTEAGPRPIEEIQVGDRVLSKQVETGELAWKPVLRTSVRPPKELYTLRLDEETLVCTGAHRFWKSGAGWVKARDLAPATLVHTVTGSTPIWTAKKGESAETYNLVVADFHTYFAGRAGVLCQDLLLPRPTNKVVPGLDRAALTADSR